MLHGQLAELSRTPYFNPSLKQYLDKLVSLIEIFISEYNKIPEVAAREVSRAIWAGSKFFTGSTSKKIPYEVVYALRHVLTDISKENCVITTALLEEQEYFCEPVEPAKTISHFISGIDFDVELIQVALPKLYRHKPLYNVALYHELGHFFDADHNIVKYCMVLDPNLKTDYSHLSEYFADIFAASYTGYAIYKFLVCICPGVPSSDSHPATDDRLKNIEDFLEGRTNKYIDAIRKIMLKLKLPELKIRYSKPDLTSCFNNIRPYNIKSIEEVHGILDASWDFLKDAQASDASPWCDIDEFEIHRIVNDLVEKSIRNRMVQEKWEHGTTE